MSRYHRQIILPEIGEKGQQKLKTASVLIVGVGGLGSPAALYLALAGVGRLGLVDFDRVDLSNLHRQILYTERDVGKSKLSVAQEKLKAFNPEIQVDLYETKLTAYNALDILKNYDVILDGTDNFNTRLLVNDACFFLKKPLVSGSIFKFEGQLSVFDAQRGPCYRCLYPEPPIQSLIPNCAEAGVLGVLPGIVGTLQATEALKLLLGIGKSLIGKLLFFDTLGMQFKELNFQKRKDCNLCGESPRVVSLQIQGGTCMSESQDNISVFDLKKRLDQGEELFLLDVRESFERDIVQLKSHSIPLKELSGRLQELDPQKEMIVYCHHGGRSQRAVDFLKEKGFQNVKNLEGGIDAWASQIDPSLERY